MRFSLAECGKGFVPTFPIRIIGGKNIRIGNNFRSGGHNYLYGNNGEILIGDNLSMNTNVQVGASGGRIVIGNNVLIGPNVVIRAADHGISREEIIRNQPYVGGEVIIEDDVWIGANAVILKNVKLGRGCVIASGGVVTKSVESYTVVGGVPAKKIFERY